MTERSIDELGPVDYLVVEFPAGQQNFTGEAAEELLRLHDAGIIRVMDLVIVGKGDDGTIMAQELGDLDNMGEFERLETELAETLAEEDVLALGHLILRDLRSDGPSGDGERDASAALSLGVDLRSFLAAATRAFV